MTKLKPTIYSEANINIKEKDERTEEPEKNEAKKKDK